MEWAVFFSGCFFSAVQELRLGVFFLHPGSFFLHSGSYACVTHVCIVSLFSSSVFRRIGISVPLRKVIPGKPVYVSSVSGSLLPGSPGADQRHRGNDSY